MSIRLIRQQSDTPSILNIDDARMIRYAYGGKNGIVKSRGTECAYSSTGSVFKINSGVIVLQGWEVELDSNGWELQLDSLTKFYDIYLEVNLASETAEIKTVYNTSGYPGMPGAGSDLTKDTVGTARMLLYEIETVSGSVRNVNKIAQVIEYSETEISELKTAVAGKISNSEINQSIGTTGDVFKTGLYSVSVPSTRYSNYVHNFLVDINDISKIFVSAQHSDAGVVIWVTYNYGKFSVNSSTHEISNVRLILPY